LAGPQAVRRLLRSSHRQPAGGKTGGFGRGN